MSGLIVAAEPVLERYSDEITGVVTLLVAFALAAAVDRALRGRAAGLAARVAGGELSPVVDTRLRFLRRVVGAVLASSAIAAAVIGFAARQVLANAIAGMVIAITQPLRIGDHVTFEDQTGTVEDISLTYTWLRMGSDARLIIPNERLAAGILRNDSIRSQTVALEVRLWLAPDADEARALEVLREIGDVTDARIADVTETGIQVLVAGPPVSPTDRLSREAELRARTLGALREAGIPRAGSG